MNTFKISLVSLSVAIPCAFAQNVNWTVSGSAGNYSGDILLGGVDIGNFTLKIDNLSAANFTDPLVGADLHARFRGPTSGISSADYDFSFTLDSGYAVTSFTMNSVGTTYDLANPVYRDLIFSGGGSAIVTDGSALTGNDYFLGLDSGSTISSGTTLTTHAGPDSIVGWRDGSTNMWGISFPTNTDSVEFSYITDGDVNTSNEEVIFDLTVVSVPEPSSLLLLGLTSLSVFRRRR